MTDETEVKKQKTFTTSTGITVRIKGIPQLSLDNVRSSVELPKPPQYKIEVAGGDVIWEYHTETTLETSDPKETAENRLLWKRYTEASAKAEALMNERVFKAVVMRGLEVDMPTDNTWLEMQEFLGVKIPTNPLELKYFYIQSEVIGNQDDVERLTEMVMGESGISEEALAEARRSFQGRVSAKDNKPPTFGNGRPRKRKVAK